MKLDGAMKPAFLLYQIVQGNIQNRTHHLSEIQIELYVLHFYWQISSSLHPWPRLPLLLAGPTDSDQFCSDIICLKVLLAPKLNERRSIKYLETQIVLSYYDLDDYSLLPFIATWDQLGGARLQGPMRPLVQAPWQSTPCFSLVDLISIL